MGKRKHKPPNQQKSGDGHNQQPGAKLNPSDVATRTEYQALKTEVQQIRTNTEGDKRHANWALGVAIVALAVSFVAAGGQVWQAIIRERAFQLERAYMTVKRLDVGRLIDEHGNTSGWHVVVVYTNTGKTVATGAGVVVYKRLGQEHSPTPEVDRTQRISVRDVGPGGDVSSRSVPITQEEAKLILTRGVEIFIHGHVR